MHERKPTTTNYSVQANFKRPTQKGDRARDLKGLRQSACHAVLGHSVLGHSNGATGETARTKFATDGHFTFPRSPPIDSGYPSPNRGTPRSWSPTYRRSTFTNCSTPQRWSFYRRSACSDNPPRDLHRTHRRANRANRAGRVIDRSTDHST